MKIKETIHQKVAVLDLKGNLMGPPETSKLVDDVKQLINDGIKRVVLDFKHVNWINSLGIGAVMKCLTEISEKEGHLVLAGLTEKVRSIFMITQLIKIFSIRETAEQAVTELNGL